MALSFDLTNIKNYDNVCWGERNDKGEANIDSWTNAFIWMTLATRVFEITEDNWMEFATRFIALHQPAHKKNKRKEKAYREHIVKKVKQHIGLKCWLTKQHQRPTGKWSDQIVNSLHDTTYRMVQHAHDKQEAQRLAKNERQRQYRQRKREATYDRQSSTPN
jgi:hypothetical protein